MTNNDQDRSITPRAASGDSGGDHPAGRSATRSTRATRGIGNGPSVAELIAVRDHAPAS